MSAFANSVEVHQRERSREREHDGASSIPKSGVRAWVYTLHHYSNEDEVVAKKINSVYHVYGREKGSATGTEHMQGLICYKSKKSMPAVKKDFKREDIHLEPKNGSFVAAAVYCKKGSATDYKGKPITWHGDDWSGFEQGVLPKDPKQCGEDGREAAIERQQNVLSMLKNGKTCKDLVDEGTIACLEMKNWEVFWERYQTAQFKSKLSAMKELPSELPNLWEIQMQCVPSDKKAHYWIYSSSCNMGKTAFAHNLRANFKTYAWNYTEKYQATAFREMQIVLMDAFHGQVSIADLESLCDGDYNFTAKGLDNWSLLKKAIIVILSNKTPEECFLKAGTDLQKMEVLKVRFTLVELKLVPDIQGADHQKLIGRNDNKMAKGNSIANF